MVIFTRWLAAFALLAVTFNPTPFNYVAWARTNGAENMPVAVLTGLVLLVCYIIFLNATMGSIGVFGMALILAIVGALIWVLNDYGILALDNQSFNVWLGVLALSLVLGIGVGWSHVRRAITGQVDVDEIDEN